MIRIKLIVIFIQTDSSLLFFHIFLEVEDNYKEKEFFLKKMYVKKKKKFITIFIYVFKYDIYIYIYIFFFFTFCYN